MVKLNAPKHCDIFRNIPFSKSLAIFVFFFLYSWIIPYYKIVDISVAFFMQHSIFQKSEKNFVEEKPWNILYLIRVKNYLFLYNIPFFDFRIPWKIPYRCDLET